MAEDMIVFTRMFDLLAWLLPKCERFPRMYRSSVTQRLMDSALDAQEQAREQDEGGHRQRRHGVWPAPDAEAGDRRPQHQSDIEDGVGMAAKASFGDESPRRVATASARDDACRTRHVSSPQSCCRPADRECGRLLHHASAVVPP